MTNEEMEDLSRYFRYIDYQDRGELLLDEYFDLEDIIKRSQEAKKMENLRFQMLMGIISEEQYHNILLSKFNYLQKMFQEKWSKEEKKNFQKVKK